MPIPSLNTDAQPPQSWDSKLIVIAGAIKYWWDENWDLPEHWEYVKWRNEVSDALVKAGYLIYRPHEAFKGTWNQKAQAVNDMAISSADLLLVLSAENIPSDGTDDEISYAERVGVPWLRTPSTYGVHHVLWAVEDALTELAR
jgi:hypothetical protein